MPPTPTDRLLTAFCGLPVTGNITAQLGRGAQIKAGGLWGASAGLLLTTVVRAHRGTVLVLTADDLDSVQLQVDLLAFGTSSHVLPCEETDDDGLPDPTSRSERQRALAQHAADKAPLIASIEALLQKTATPKSQQRGKLELQAGQKVDRTQVLLRAERAGLRSVPLVLAPGECSVRGDVVDLYPMAADAAVRLEFLDDELESIRTFDPSTQRTTAVLDTYVRV